MRLVLSLAISCVFACTFTMNAQNTNNPTQYDTHQKTDKQYIDKNGSTYYVDKQGVAYYLDKDGHPYNIDSEGYTYYLDDKGAPYYFDNQGSVYYLDNNGIPYYIDERGKPFYYNQNGDIVYYNQNSKLNSSNTGNYPSNQSYNKNNNSMAYIATDETDKFRLAIGGGYSYRLGNSYGYNITRSGFNLDADTQLFLSEDYGIGLACNHTKTKIIKQITQKITFIAPTFAIRSNFDKFMLIYNFGLGPIFFKESYDKSLPIMFSKYTKTTVGISSSIGFEYKLSNNLGLGIKLSGIFGSFEDNKYSDERASVSSLNLTGFVSFKAK